MSKGLKIYNFGVTAAVAVGILNPNPLDPTAEKQQQLLIRSLLYREARIWI